MQIRTIALAVVTIATLSPAISYATPERASARACAHAFAATLAQPGSAAPVYKVAYRSSMGSMIADFYPSEHSFTLEAHDPKTGATLARAECQTDAHGAVTSIAALPLLPKSATMASDF